MKRQLLTALSLVLLAQPVLADQSFDNLMAERKSLVRLVFQGKGDASTVARIDNLTSQIQAKIDEKTEKQQDQQSALVQNMDRVDSQMQSVSQILFGGTSVNTSATSQNAPPAQSVGGMPLTTYSPPLGDEIEKLVRTAVMKTPSEANRMQDKYSKPLQKFIAMTKESINFTIPYRGYGPTTEAANLILGNPVALKSLSIAEYQQQSFVDQTHMEVTLEVLQLAQGLGNSDLPRAEAAYKRLSELADTASADRVKALLDSQLNNSASPPAQLDILGRQAKYQSLLKAALEKDVVIKDIQTKLHKYNTHGKVRSAVQQVVPAILGIASCVPNFVGPIARSMLSAFLTATGGPDAKKLLDELYLAEKLQSRTALLSQEIQVELAGLDRNESPVLNYACQSLLEQ